MTKDGDKRVYNLQSKQIVKLFSRIFNLRHQEMLDDLSNGDVSDTVAKYFEKSKSVKPKNESTLTLMDVDEFLEELSKQTQEERQAESFEAISKKCTTGDLKTIIRLIKHDLKMSCGSRHVLDALSPDAYSSFQKSRDLKLIIREYGGQGGGKKTSKSTKSSSGLQVMTAISPMLAEPCKDFDKAIRKCPEGFYSEIKYDGERVQIHKQGKEFKFFSRNLKPVMDHKVAKLKEFLPKAFPHAADLIVDSEILMVDTKSGDLLPFGTLGKHKKEECSTAETCLFIFDCLYFNGKDLTKKPMNERRKFLEENLTVIKHHVQLSEYKLLKTKNDLVDMTKEVLKKGLEGLVLKGLDTIYEPGKRRWLKVKKDYLLKGAIADTADLVVLGAWYGTGKMGGQYSIFLMGCYDNKSRLWKTVTKVHSGLDDKQMEKLHSKLKPLMEKCDVNSKLPKWIQLNRTMIPNAIAKDPTKMPVFEVTGAEFTQSEVHTASSISIRFPRITKIRTDKSPEQATSLEELVHLFNESKAGVNLDELNKLKTKSSDDTKDKVKTENIFTKIASVSTNEKMKRKSEEAFKVESPAKKIKIEEELIDEPYKIFEGFMLFQTDEIKQKYHEEIKDFISRGGSLTDDSQSASLVLYDGNQIENSTETLRKLYSPRCSHHQVSWLHDCLKENKLVNPLRYFIRLNQIRC